MSTNIKVIKIPKIFNTNTAKDVINELNEEYQNSIAKNYEAIVFDFAQCKKISPVGLIYIKMWRDELNDRGKKTYYRKSNNATESFLRRMGLLQPVNKVENEKVTEEFSYAIHSCKNVEECSKAQGEIIANVVQRGKLTDETYSSVGYMMNELWDNAGVHGYCCYLDSNYPKPVYICALEYENHFEISIGDRGQGIYKSLSNQQPKIKNGREAVLKSIEYGVSGHPNGSPGFGLFCSAEFLRKGQGELQIWSSGCFLDVSSTANKVYTSNFKHGTLISLNFSKSAEMPFEKVLSHLELDEYIEILGGMFDE